MKDFPKHFDPKIRMQRITNFYKCLEKVTPAYDVRYFLQGMQVFFSHFYFIQLNGSRMWGRAKRGLV